MKHFDDLSIATTVHNNAEMSAAMLKSFAEHVGSVREIVIVDDGSTVPLAEELDWLNQSSSSGAAALGSSVRVLRNETPLGFCKASDIALRNVRTPCALLVDADVLFQPGDFAGGFDEFRRGNWAWMNFRQRSFGGVPQNAFEQPLMPPWVFAAGNQFYSAWEKRYGSQSPLASADRIAAVEAAHSSCTLVDTAAFHAIGGFDLWYAQCQSDIEISLRFRKHGYGVGVDLRYEVKHEGAGGRTGGDARVLDLYRARVHLYESAFPSSRFYLRPLLFARHLLELLWFAVKGDRAQRHLRSRMLRTVWSGYE